MSRSGISWLSWPEPDAMRAAVAAGVMFSQPRTEEHDGWVRAARQAAAALPAAEVRHDQVDYIAFDLEQFSRAPRLEPTPADIDLGRQVIGHLAQLPPRTTAAQAASQLRMIRGNNQERGKLVDILGICVLRRYLPQLT